jgi:hypothetical protein
MWDTAHRSPAARPAHGRGGRSAGAGKSRGGPLCTGQARAATGRRSVVDVVVQMNKWDYIKFERARARNARYRKQSDINPIEACRAPLGKNGLPIFGQYLAQYPADIWPIQRILAEYWSTTTSPTRNRKKCWRRWFSMMGTSDHSKQLVDQKYR